MTKPNSPYSRLFQMSYSLSHWTVDRTGSQIHSPQLLSSAPDGMRPNLSDSHEL